MTIPQYKELLRYLHEGIITGHFQEIFDMISALDFSSNELLMLHARAAAGLNRFQDALNFLDKMSTFRADYYWLKFLCFKKLNNEVGAFSCIRKFNPNSIPFLRATIDDQLNHRFLVSPLQGLTIPILLKRDGEPVELGYLYDGLLTTDDTHFFEYNCNIVSDPNLDCRSIEYRAAKMNLIKQLCISEERAHELPQQINRLNAASWGILILIGPFVSKVMNYDVELATLLATEYENQESPDPVWDRIWNSSDELPNGLYEDMLYTPTGHRIHRVVARVLKKNQALNLLKNFMTAPLMGREIIFCGHGQKDTGDWVFMDDEYLTFDDFLGSILEWEPVHILSNCCYSKIWGEKWQTVLQDFPNPAHCGVSLTANSTTSPQFGGQLMEQIPYITSISSIQRIDELLNLNSKPVDITFRDRPPPEDFKSLLPLTEEIRQRRINSVLSDQPFPYGFENFDNFERFANNIFNSLTLILGANDCELRIHGSSINGFSWKTKPERTRLFVEQSDYDVGIISQTLFDQGDNVRGVRVANAGSDPHLCSLCLRNGNLEMEHGGEIIWPDLLSLIQNASELTNHPVSIVIYPTKESASNHTGCSLTVNNNHNGITTFLNGTLWPKSQAPRSVIDENSQTLLELEQHLEW